MIQHLIDTHFHLDYYKEHQKIYDGINERKQYIDIYKELPPKSRIRLEYIYPVNAYIRKQNI